MKKGSVSRKKYYLTKDFGRSLALILAIVILANGNGMTVFAQEIGEQIEEFIETSEVEETSEYLEEDVEDEGVEEHESYSDFDCVEETESEMGSEVESDEFLEREMENEESVTEEDILLTESAEILHSGDWGKYTHWSLDSNGLLMVTQDSDVEYELFNDAYDPWFEYKDEIKHMHIDATCIVNYGKIYSDKDYVVHEIDFSYAEEIGKILPMYKNLKTITFGEQFDSSYITDMSYMFYKCENVTYIQANKLDMSNATNVKSMFEDCYSLEELDFSSVQTTKEVYSIEGMFKNCASLKKLDISSFDFMITGDDISEVFYNCSELEELDLSVIDTSNVSFFENVFYKCNSLKKIDLSSWDMSKASRYSLENFGLQDCYRLNRIETPFNIKYDIKIPNNKWKYEDGNELGNYYLPTNLTESVSLSGVHVYIITFDGQGGNDKEPVYVLEGIGNYLDSTGGKTNQLFWGWYTEPNGEGEEFTVMTDVQSDMTVYAYWQGEETDIIQDCYNQYKKDGISWRIDKDNNLYAKGVGNFYAGDCLADKAPWYEYKEQILTATITLRNIDDASYLLNDCANLKEATLIDWDCSRLTDIQSMFSDCEKLEKVDLSGLDTSQVVDMSNMFDNCSSLKELDLSNFNTSQAVYMYDMFKNCSSLIELNICNFDTRNVKYFYFMFASCHELETIGCEFDISSAHRTDYMFTDCGKLKSISFTGENKGILNCVSDMFYMCDSLEKLDISMFDLSGLDDEVYGVRSNEGMIGDCASASLKSIEAPINLQYKVFLDSPEGEGWVRTDTNELITTLPTGLDQSITLERRAEVKPVDVTGISLNETSLSMLTGQTYQLTATVTPENATDKTVSWSTSNASVVSVDSNGLLTAHGAGTAIITAKAQGGEDVSATCNITVEKLAQTLEVTFNKAVNDAGEYVLILNEAVSPKLNWKDGKAWPEVTYTVSNDTAEFVDGKLVPKKVGSGVLTVATRNDFGVGPMASVKYCVSDIPEGLWITAIEEQTYTGSAIKPEVQVYDGDKLLEEKKDYTVSYSNNVNAAAADSAKAPTVTVKGKGNYTGKKTATFNIRKVDLSDELLDITFTDAYTATSSKNPKLVFSAKYNGKALKVNKDYSLTVKNANGTVTSSYSEEGKYTLVVAATGSNYSGSKEFSFEVTKKIPVSKLKVGKIAKAEYTGKEHTPVLSVKSGKTELVLNRDYTVTYEDNIEVGTATAVITGMGDYVGSRKVAFQITGRPMKSVKTINFRTSMAYTGEEIYQPGNLQLVFGKNQQRLGTNDYTVEYSNNVEKGTATVLFTGQGHYTGTLKKTFKITAFNLNTNAGSRVRADIPATGISVAYAKGGAAPKIDLYDGERLLIEGEDYTLSYKNNKAVASATAAKKPQIIVKGKGNYTGKLNHEIYFTITEKALSDVIVTAPDVAVSSKYGKFKSKVVLTDVDGKKLSAGKDYDKKLAYTYKNETKVKDMSLNEEVVRASGEVVGAKDVIPANTVLCVTINAKAGGVYTGSVCAEYKVAPILINKAKITVMNPDKDNKSQFEYTGHEVILDKKNLKVVVNGVTLKDNEYDILEETYQNNITRGTASVQIEGVGDTYGGVATVKYKIGAQSFWRWFH